MPAELVKRDAARTRRRILDAAIDEFSRFGIAGARIDRIADASGANKAMIYRYFGNKDQLFDAVFDSMVVATVDGVPLDCRDLPRYAAALFEQHRKNPKPLRIATWDRLERDGLGDSLPSVRTATEQKLAKIREAQDTGYVSRALSAEAVLRFVLAMSQTSSGGANNDIEAHEIEALVRAALS